MKILRSKSKTPPFKNRRTGHPKFKGGAPGQTITYLYDALNRLTSKTYPDTTAVDYVYDLVGKIQQVNDPTGTYAFAYDNMGRLIGTTTSYSFLTSRNFTNAYTYDAASNRTGFTDPESGSTAYTYDTLNRLTSLAPPSAFGSGSFGFSYDALSRRTQMTRSNSVTTNYTYDNLSRLLSVLHQLSGSTIDGASYTLDSAGNRTAKTDPLAAVTSNYTYDAIYQLTQVTQANNTTESYAYDPVGNRTASLGVSSYTTNASNELTGTSNASYTYDSNGNMLTKTVGSNTTSYTWDYENRLTSVTLPGSGGTVTFKYDFHKWYHRCWKLPGDRDATQGEIEAAYEEWVRRGMPQNGKCTNPEPEPEPCPQQQRQWDPTQLPIVGPVLNDVADRILSWLDDRRRELRHWNPGPNPGPGPIPLPIQPFPVVP